MKKINSIYEILEELENLDLNNFNKVYYSIPLLKKNIINPIKYIDCIYRFFCQISYDLSEEKNNDDFIHKKEQINSNLNILKSKHSNQIDELKKLFDVTYQSNNHNLDFEEKLKQLQKKQTEEILETQSLKSFYYDKKIIETWKNLIKIYIDLLEEKQIVISKLKESLIDELSKNDYSIEHIEKIVKIVLLISINDQTISNIDEYIFKNHIILRDKISDLLSDGAIFQSIKSGFKGGLLGSGLSTILPAPIKLWVTVGSSIYSGIKGYNDKKNISIFVTLIIDVYIYLYLIRKGYRNSDIDEKENINEYYTILESNESDSNEDIRRKYKELLKSFHPDKIEGKDLHPEFINFANEKMKLINEAYNYIKELRNIK